MSPLIYQWSNGGLLTGATIQLVSRHFYLYVMKEHREQDVALSGDVLIVD